MSLYLPDQKLGSHSSEGGSSNKFMLKGRQTGGVHRGHSWVFRAESHDTMMAWYEDLKILTEKTPQERSIFVRQHARSVSGASQRPSSISSDGAFDDDDEEPFSAAASADVVAPPPKQEMYKRPEPGRFPSDVNLTNHDLQAPLSPSSGSSGFGEHDDHHFVEAAAAQPAHGIGEQHVQRDTMEPTHASELNSYAAEDGVNPYTSEPITQSAFSLVTSPVSSPPINSPIISPDAATNCRQDSPVLAGAVGLTTAGAAEAYHNKLEDRTGGQSAAESYSDAEAAQQHAVTEAAAPSAPDTEHLEAQAAQEALQIAAPDIATPLQQPNNFHELSSVAAYPAATPLAPEQDFQTGPDFNSHNHSELLDHVTHGKLDTTDGSNPIEDVLNPLARELERPILAAGQSHRSVATISMLHVPGEFPRTIDSGNVEEVGRLPV